MKDILCLPCESSFTEDVTERHPDWELINCPVCGRGCYTSPRHKQTLAQYPKMTAACTQCALRGGNPVPPKVKKERTVDHGR